MQVVEDLRSIATVANLGHVVGINHVITVDILVLDITRIYGREVLLRAGIDISLVAEQSDGHQTIGRVQRIACLHEVAVGTRLLGLLLDLVLVEVEHSTYVEGQIAQCLGVVERELKSLAVHLTCIDVRSVESDKRRIGTCTRHPDILALLHVEVEFHIQAAKECGIETKVIFVGLLMAGVQGRKQAKGGVGIHHVVTSAERIAARSR